MIQLGSASNLLGFQPNGVRSGDMGGQVKGYCQIKTFQIVDAATKKFVLNASAWKSNSELMVHLNKLIVKFLFIQKTRPLLLTGRRSKIS
jgi:hypothetical protein